MSNNAEAVILPKKTRNLLIIDDDVGFAEVAKKALNPVRHWMTFTASAYEEALDKLEHGITFRYGGSENTYRIDAVITDLFFPSQIDWRDELLLKLTEQVGKNDRSHGMPSENPSGLAIAQWCYERKMPFVMISQGDRHKGNFGLVRDHLANKVFLDAKWDPLPRVMVRGGSSIDKNDPCIWLEAMIYLMQNGAG